jgi:ferredoxin
MRILVDRDLCVGTGTCVGICPEVFELNNDECVAVVKVDEVPASAEAACREAMYQCPVEAIKAIVK